MGASADSSMEAPMVKAPAAMMTWLLIAGHIPGLGGDIGIHRRALLDALAEGAPATPRIAQGDGLDDIGALLVRSGE